MEVPADVPSTCPVCGLPYDSVSRHDGGLLVNLLDNDHYRRVCFRPVTVDGVGRVDFYHHTHDQVDDASPDGSATANAGQGTTADAGRGTTAADRVVTPAGEDERAGSGDG